MKLYIGVAGEKRAGKDTFCGILKNLEMKWNLKVSIHRFSDPISECLDSLALPKTRENMQRFSPLIESGYGKGVFSRALKARAEQDPAPIVILQGLRWWSDVAELQSLNGVLFYITADKDIRFARSLGNSEKPDEANMAREKFEEQERAETEIYIPEIGATANFRFENNETQEQFTEKVCEFFEENI